ncbi:MAG: hypothetical protein Q8742_02460 [Candidatus Phytoplasma australasiaticum]|nr:hypothetical protein [Candidatus Phytoplasma australasiaticum]
MHLKKKFSKKFIIIIIFTLGLIILMINNKFNEQESWFDYKDSQNSHNNQEELHNNQEELIMLESKSGFGSKNHFSYDINKIKITSARFNNIKDYILENTDNIPDDLTSKEMYEINSIRNKYKQNYQFLKHKKSYIDKNKAELNKKEAKYFDVYCKFRSLKDRFKMLETKIYSQSLQINELKPNFKLESFLNENKNNNNFVISNKDLLEGIKSSIHEISVHNPYRAARLEQQLLHQEKVKSEWIWLNEDNYPDKSKKIDLTQNDILSFINEISLIKSKITKLEQDLLEQRLIIKKFSQNQQIITEDYEENNRKYQQVIISNLKCLYDIT